MQKCSSITDCELSRIRPSTAGVSASCPMLNLIKQISLSECLDMACEVGGNVVNFYLDGGGVCPGVNSCIGPGQCWIMRCESLSNIRWTTDWFGADVFILIDKGR